MTCNSPTVYLTTCSWSLAPRTTLATSYSLKGFYTLLSVVPPVPTPCLSLLALLSNLQISTSSDECQNVVKTYSIKHLVLQKHQFWLQHARFLRSTTTQPLPPNPLPLNEKNTQTDLKGWTNTLSRCRPDICCHCGQGRHSPLACPHFVKYDMWYQSGTRIWTQSANSRAITDPYQIA